MSETINTEESGRKPSASRVEGKADVVQLGVHCKASPPGKKKC